MTLSNFFHKSGTKPNHKPIATKKSTFPFKSTVSSSMNETVPSSTAPSSSASASPPRPAPVGTSVKKHGSQVLDVEVAESSKPMMEWNQTLSGPSTHQQPHTLPWNDQKVKEDHEDGGNTTVDPPVSTSSLLEEGTDQGQLEDSASEILPSSPATSDSTKNGTSDVNTTDVENSSCDTPGPQTIDLTSPSSRRSTRKRKQATVLLSMGQGTVGSPQSTNGDQDETSAPAEEPHHSKTAKAKKKASSTGKRKRTASEPLQNLPPEAPPLSEERLALLAKHADMIKRCQQRSQELVVFSREGLEGQDYQMPLPEHRHDLPDEEEFPDAVVKNMAVLIEGR